MSSSGVSLNDFNQNVIINGGFTVNQRVYTSAATLATTVYGHDRWKAGAAGGDYSFTQLANNTQITIASGKTLIQVVEDKNVVGGTYTLSWEGTAQGRYAINSATPAGSYVDSPITITGQTAGTTMSVEFDDGTLGKVQLESGSSPTAFEYRQFRDELALCQRYYEKSYDYATSIGTDVGKIGMTSGESTDGSYIFAPAKFKVSKRATPTVLIYSEDGSVGDVSTAGGGHVGTGATIARDVGETGINEIWEAGRFNPTIVYFYHYTAISEL
jgi:hypothetical protein